MKHSKRSVLFRIAALYLLLHVFVFAYLQVACQSANALQTTPIVRATVSDTQPDSWQVTLLQNTYTIPRLQHTVFSTVPVYADSLSCFLYFLCQQIDL
jgi:hypothetical protein